MNPAAPAKRKSAAAHIGKTLGIQCTDGPLVILKSHLLELHTLYWLIIQIEAVYSGLARVVQWVDNEQSFDIDALRDFRDFLCEMTSEFTLRLDWIQREAGYGLSFAAPTKNLLKCIEQFSKSTSTEISKSVKEIATHHGGNGKHETESQIFDRLRGLSREQKDHQKVIVEPALNIIRSNARQAQQQVNDIRARANELSAKSRDALRTLDTQLTNRIVADGEQ